MCIRDRHRTFCIDGPAERYLAGRRVATVIRSYHSPDLSPGTSGLIERRCIGSGGERRIGTVVGDKTCIGNGSLAGRRCVAWYYLSSCRTSGEHRTFCIDGPAEVFLAERTATEIYTR